MTTPNKKRAEQYWVAPVKAPLPCSAASTWFCCGEDIYEAYPWVAGNPFPGTEEAVSSVAENLALLHKAGQSFGKTYLKGGHLRAECAPERLLSNAALSKGVTRECDATVEEYESQVILAAERLDDTTYHSLPKTLVHGDVQPANAIFEGSRLLSFVDYDWLGNQPVIYDLAFGLMTFCGKREQPLAGGDIWSLTAPIRFDEKSARSFLEAYMAVAGEFDSVMRSALMEQMRLLWAHVRIDGALKVSARDRPRFFARDYRGTFSWIEDHRKGDWF